ncbi:hypothetical protein [Desulfobulbus alkaliphilus]|uniref:hypothetical protein n=1 Tax=Desulfobulbus alkaliphilus TaxID=869814 RepID=UPI0019639398|nr:hypothetical protein [Desulfobulbus alkaliphilus]MBM9536194.1 hypothetical protein [Desulfobulbus alkaliphilus]
MNRRTFLRTLASLGVTITLPLDLLNASQEEVDTAWHHAKKAWDLFEVDAHGTLSYANFTAPRLRRELYWYSRVEDIDWGAFERSYALEERIKNLYHQELLLAVQRKPPASGMNREALEEQVEEEWYDWFEQADGKDREAINA